MSRAPHAVAPEFERYELRRHLRSGGFADVFLYWDRALGREVAVKVLATGAATEEAKVMARVSSHPYIVDVYETGTTDDGRPYIVMQYYPGPTFADRLAQGPLGLPEALRVTIRLCGALSTAHAAGILHRDVKPANVLTNEFEALGLADFGIASHPEHAGVMGGLSLPWAPPELLRGEPADERSDVYSLAATFFTLIEGHAPFVRPGGSNSESELIFRTLNQPAPELRVADATDQLRAVLRAALSKDRSTRPRTAEQFGRALQAVETELHLRQTTMDVKGTSPAVRPADAHETRGRSVRVIDPDQPAADPTRGRAVVAIDSVPTALPRNGSTPAAIPVPAVSAAPTLDDTYVPIDQEVEGDDSRARRAPSPLLVVVGGLVAAAAVLVVAVAFGGGGTSTGGSSPNEFGPVSTIVPDGVVPRDVEVRADGAASVQVTWSDHPVAPNGWEVRRVDEGASDGGVVFVTEPSYTISGLRVGERPCVDVRIRGEVEVTRGCLAAPLGSAS